MVQFTHLIVPLKLVDVFAAKCFLAHILGSGSFVLVRFSRTCDSKSLHIGVDVAHIVFEPL